jgi:riboflavin kinase/FMN adenylyltransferase
MVITFDMLPQHYLSKSHIANRWQGRKIFIGSLTDNAQKAVLIESLGVDYLWFLKTNRALLELSGKKFIDYLCRYFSLQELIVGDDFRFGYGGRNSIDYLRQLASEYGFTLTVIAKRSFYSEPISSSRIRELVRNGQMQMVHGLLGRYFSVRSKVVRGKKIGRSLGFPTANIYIRDYVSPPSGVYAAYVVAGKCCYQAGVYIGESAHPATSPTLIEAHCIGVNKKLLGSVITVIFLEKIREKRKFRSFSALRAAIQKDILHITSKYSTPSGDRTQPIVS